MKFDKTVEVFTHSLAVPDPFGGFTSELQSVGEYSAFLTPATDELTLSEGIVIKVTVIKLFTKEDIPADATKVKCDGKEYEVLAYTDYGKIKQLRLKEM